MEQAAVLEAAIRTGRFGSVTEIARSVHLQRSTVSRIISRELPARPHIAAMMALWDGHRDVSPEVYGVLAQTERSAQIRSFWHELQRDALRERVRRDRDGR